MAVVTNKRSVMTLYSGSSDIYSHQVRIILAEKGVTVDVVDINPFVPPEDFMQINPYGSVPTLVDRDLVLFQARIINEYLDERFPHPPLMPVYPVARAQCRLMMYRIERDWYTLVHKINLNENATQTAAFRKELRDSLVSVAPLFAEQNYFLSEEFTLVDCSVAPLLWRLPLLGIELPAQAKAIKQYATKVFARDTFQASLTDAEREWSQTALAK